MPTTTTTLTDAQLAQLSEVNRWMRTEFERCYGTTEPAIRGLIGEGRSLWDEGVRNVLEKKRDDAKQNFRKAAVLTWEAAERLALTSPEEASRLAAESLAFEGLATSMRAQAAVGLERRKRLMIEAENLVSTAEVSLKGRRSVAVAFSSDIISARMSTVFNTRTSATVASPSSDATRREGHAADVARGQGSKLSSPRPPLQRRPPRARALTL